MSQSTHDKELFGDAEGSPASDAALATLLRRASEGDAQAWATLVNRYTDRVYGLLVSRCQDRELAEELTQATFVKVVTRLSEVTDSGETNDQETAETPDAVGSAGDEGVISSVGSSETPGSSRGYEERGRFEPWLLRIALNTLRDEMRRRGRQIVGRGDRDTEAPWAAEASDQPTPLQHLDHAERLDELRAAVAKLPEADQEVLHLRHTTGLSFADIAATLNQPLGTVLARGHRALGKLRRMLSEGEQTQPRATKPKRPRATAARSR